MTYKVTEEGNISTVFLNGEIDMDVTENAKEVILQGGSRWVKSSITPNHSTLKN